MSYLKCSICREGEGCQALDGVSLEKLFTPRVCLVITAVCTCISVVSFLAVAYVTLK